jgi:hypothetical protein
MCQAVSEKAQDNLGGGHQMEHLLAGSRIRLTYLQDRRALSKINWPNVYEDLADAGTIMNYSRWCELDALTHVVLATDRMTGRYAGVLGVTRRTTAGEPWLLVEVALARPGEPDTMLARALLAHILARIVCLDGKPVAIAAPKVSQSGMFDLYQSIQSAVLYPPLRGNVISFHTGRLAREIGAGAMVLDLRPIAELSLLRDLRDLHGLRPERLKSIAMGKPAKTVGATRRPRKATQTGRTG